MGQLVFHEPSYAKGDVVLADPLLQREYADLFRALSGLAQGEHGSLWSD